MGLLRSTRTCVGFCVEHGIGGDKRDEIPTHPTPRESRGYIEVQRDRVTGGPRPDKRRCDP